MAGSKDRPPSPSTPERASWLKLDIVTLGSAFALTLVAGVYAYLSNLQLGTDELFFLLLVFCAVVLGARWLWHKFVGSRTGGK